MDNLSTTSSDLFNKIRSRFSNIKIGDETGVVITDPTNARFFDFNFNKHGQVNIKLDEESLVIIYPVSMFKSMEDKTEWFKFLKEMRLFAKKNLLRFDTRDISKSNLEKRDYHYLSGENKMSESKMFGTSKTSYQDIGEARLVVKHTQPINIASPAGRTQRIESIYIESNGERFRYPFKHLNGARAMANHIAHGGVMHDEIGKYISGLSEELGKLRQFKNYTSRFGVMSETFNDIPEKVASRMDDVKLEIANLQKSSYYTSFKESFKPIDDVMIPEDTINQWVDALTIRTFNEELKSAFPYIYKLVSEKIQNLQFGDLVSEDSDKNEDDEESETAEDKFEKEFEENIAEISPAFEEPCDCNEGTMNPCEDCEQRMACPDAQAETEEEPPSEHAVAKEPTITKEIIEFVKSMYNAEDGTFPRGAEAVKIAAEKKYGPQAGKFAEFVVNRLSGQTEGMAGSIAGGVAGAMVGKTPSSALAGAEIGGAMQDAGQSELARIRSLSGL